MEEMQRRLDQEEESRKKMQEESLVSLQVKEEARLKAEEEARLAVLAAEEAAEGARKQAEESRLQMEEESSARRKAQEAEEQMRRAAAAKAAEEAAAAKAAEEAAAAKAAEEAAAAKAAEEAAANSSEEAAAAKAAELSSLDKGIELATLDKRSAPMATADGAASILAASHSHSQRATAINSGAVAAKSPADRAAALAAMPSEAAALAAMPSEEHREPIEMESEINSQQHRKSPLTVENQRDVDCMSFAREWAEEKARRQAGEEAHVQPIQLPQVSEMLSRNLSPLAQNMLAQRTSQNSSPVTLMAQRAGNQLESALGAISPPGVSFRLHEAARGFPIASPASPVASPGSIRAHSSPCSNHVAAGMPNPQQVRAGQQWHRGSPLKLHVWRNNLQPGEVRRTWHVDRSVSEQVRSGR